MSFVCITLNYDIFPQGTTASRPLKPALSAASPWDLIGPERFGGNHWFHIFHPKIPYPFSSSFSLKPLELHLQGGFQISLLPCFHFPWPSANLCGSFVEAVWRGDAVRKAGPRKPGRLLEGATFQEPSSWQANQGVGHTAAASGCHNDWGNGGQSHSWCLQRLQSGNGQSHPCSGSFVVCVAVLAKHPWAAHNTRNWESCGQIVFAIKR